MLNRRVMQRAHFGLCVSLPKSTWRQVPKPGCSLVARVNGERRLLLVETEPCSCRGRRLHEHRFLTLPGSAGLVPDQQVVIEV